MLANLVKQAVLHQAKRRWALFTTAFAVTVSPAKFVSDGIAANPSPLPAAIRFLTLAVATVLLIEGAFSLAFNTEFSDLLHNAFPIFGAVTGGFVLYLIFKLMWTPNVTLTQTLTGAFYVGGTALLVMTGLIFLFLTVDFGLNYQSVLSSGCEPRTIMCLISGNTQTDYGLMQDVATQETQGASFGPIIWTILGSLIVFSAVLSSVFKTMMNVSRWRTILAAGISAIVLLPAFILLINLIYRWYYMLSPGTGGPV